MTWDIRVSISLEKVRSEITNEKQKANYLLVFQIIGGIFVTAKTESIKDGKSFIIA